MYRYPLIIEKGDDVYAGYFPDIPGSAVMGDTPDDVIRNARDVLLSHMEYFKKKGETVPDATNAVRMAFVEVKESEVDEYIHQSVAPIIEG